MRMYPYWIVEWGEGRMQAPPELKHTPIGKMFERGQIGGRRRVEREAGTPEEALRLWRQKRDMQMLGIYVVRAPGQPRERVSPEALARG